MKDYQIFTEYIGMPCCVMSVEKKEDGSCGEIRIIAANKAYRETMGPAYYDGMIYSELVPQDNKFEDYCYRAAVLGQKMHAYVETKALNAWTDQTLIPLESDREDAGYCQFIFEFTEMPEADRMAAVNAETAEKVIEACIKLMGSDDFKAALDETVDVIIDASDAKGGRIMLLDHNLRKPVILSDRSDEAYWAAKIVDDTGDVITYDLLCRWESLIGVSNAVIVKDEHDMDELEAMDPEWVRSMREGGVTSLVLVPLRRDNAVIGYLYVVNFDVEKIVEVKELTELMGFFLTSEIVNYLLVNKLDHISKIDALTGINNRRAMIERMKDLTASCGAVPFGVINIDLNGLKRVNDLQGHDAGDRLIIQAGEILRKVFYDDDIFRTGGDEFIVITNDIDRDTFDRKVGRLRRDVLKNSEVSFAMGTFWTDGSTDITTAFRNADETMYADKQLFYEIHPELRR